MNLYRYCGNDPVNNSDPAGEESGHQTVLDGGENGNNVTIEKVYAPPIGSHIPAVVENINGQQWFDSPGQPAVNLTSLFGASTANSLFGSSGVNTASGDVNGTDADASADPNFQIHTPSPEGLPQPVKAIADVIGKIWNIPNDIIGVVVGIAGLPFGGSISGFGNNAIQFSSPFGGKYNGAITFGNVQLFHNAIPQEYDFSSYTGYYINIGVHEQAHTYQSQFLGPLFLPLYLLNGGVSHNNPFEIGADVYSSEGPLPPGGG